MQVDNKGIGMLVDLDRCLGCFSCQTACRQANGYDYDTSWLKVVRQTPEEIDGELRLFYLIAPFALDKCSECITRKNPPHCVASCMTQCLYVAPIEKLLPMVAKKKHVQLIT